MTDFTYAPGRFVAVCSGATIAMLDRSVEHPLVTLVWDAAAAGWSARMVAVPVLGTEFRRHYDAS